MRLKSKFFPWIYYPVAVIVTVISYLYSYRFLSNSMLHQSGGNTFITLLYAVAAVLFLFFVDRRRWSERFSQENKALNLLFVITPLATALIDQYRNEFEKSIENFILGWDLLAVIICVIFVSVSIVFFEKCFKK